MNFRSLNVLHRRKECLIQEIHGLFHGSNRNMSKSTVETKSEGKKKQMITFLCWNCIFGIYSLDVIRPFTCYGSQNANLFQH